MSKFESMPSCPRCKSLVKPAAIFCSFCGCRLDVATSEDGEHTSRDTDQSLVECLDCHKLVSKQALTCPNCGCPVANLIRQKSFSLSDAEIKEISNNLPQHLVGEHSAILVDASLGNHSHYHNGIGSKHTIAWVEWQDNIVGLSVSPGYIHFLPGVESLLSLELSNQTNPANPIGGAVLGGLLFGGVGAVVGAIAGASGQGSSRTWPGLTITTNTRGLGYGTLTLCFDTSESRDRFALFGAEILSIVATGKRPRITDINGLESFEGGPKGNTGKLVVIRSSSTTGSSCAVSIFVDGILRGKVLDGETISIGLAAGRRLIKVEGGALSKVTTIKVAVGQRVQYKVHFSVWGLLGGGLHFDPF